MSRIRRLLLLRLPGALYVRDMIRPWGRVPPMHRQFCLTRNGGQCDCFVKR